MYSEDGFVDDLPDLNDKRRNHACQSYLNHENKLVINGGRGRPCDKMGRMDGMENGKWSHCSNEEFEEWYRRAGHTCGIFRP